MVARLFRCPFSQSANALSYFVVNGPRDGMPLLVCADHPGVLIKAYYVPRPDGGYGVEVEEEVRELSDPALTDAVQSFLQPRW